MFAVVDRAAIEAAAQRIGAHVRTTPVVEVEANGFDASGKLVLKLECLQHTGSFKPRGALNRMLSMAIPAAGVIAASGGNHGLAVAWAARRLGYRAEIFVPMITPAIKVSRLRELGAVVNQVGAVYADAFAASQVRQAETGAVVVHAYDQPEVVAGQGTMAMELEQQCAAIDTVVVAVGGGGFIGGITAWYGGRARIIGVEPETSCALHAALAAGEPVDVDVSGVAADSLGARRVGGIAFPILRRHVQEVVLVTDDEIGAAARRLWRDWRVIAEPGGAAALAAVLSGRYRPAPDERVAVVVCGANCDPATLSS